jgi:hypothetical protein
MATGGIPHSSRLVGKPPSLADTDVDHAEAFGHSSRLPLGACKSDPSNGRGSLID